MGPLTGTGTTVIRLRFFRRGVFGGHFFTAMTCAVDACGDQRCVEHRSTTATLRHQGRHSWKKWTGTRLSRPLRAAVTVLLAWSASTSITCWPSPDLASCGMMRRCTNALGCDDTTRRDPFDSLFSSSSSSPWIFAAAKESLPPEAYFNRTVYPRMTDFDQVWRTFLEANGGRHRVDDAAQLPSNRRRRTRPDFSLGIISDVQYAERDEEKRRHFRLSPQKLQRAIDEMNANRSHLDAVVNLGDLVDGNMDKYFPTLKPILSSSRAPVYHVLGNHDFLGLEESKYDAWLVNLLTMPARYYSVEMGPPLLMYSTSKGSLSRRHASGQEDAISSRVAVMPAVDERPGAAVGENSTTSASAVAEAAPKRGMRMAANVAPGGDRRRAYRLLFLDGNDLSMYGTVSGTPKRKEAVDMLGQLMRSKSRNARKFNGGLGKAQLEWLHAELRDACELGQSAVILLHHPMRPAGEPTNLWNDVAVVPELVRHDCVLAVFTGHSHKWLYDFHLATAPVERDGEGGGPDDVDPRRAPHPARSVHFVTFGGMVQSPFTSFAFADFYHHHHHNEDENDDEGDGLRGGSPKKKEQSIEEAEGKPPQHVATEDHDAKRRAGSRSTVALLHIHGLVFGREIDHRLNVTWSRRKKRRRLDGGDGPVAEATSHTASPPSPPPVRRPQASRLRESKDVDERSPPTTATATTTSVATGEAEGGGPLRGASWLLWLITASLAAWKLISCAAAGHGLQWWGGAAK